MGSVINSYYKKRDPRINAIEENKLRFIYLTGIIIYPL